MRNTMLNTFICVAILLLLLTAGCAMQNPPKKPQPDNQINWKTEQIQINPDLAEKVTETAKSIKGVKDSAAVVINREISVGIKVVGFDRLFLKQIKKEVAGKIKNLNKNYEIYLTADKKLLAQLKQIEEQARTAQGKSLADIKKKVKRINKDME